MWIGLTLVREAIRALAFPIHMLCYVPQHRRWRELARQTLHSAAASHTDALDEFTALGGITHDGPPHLLISAGEASGEIHAVNVMRELAGMGPRWSCFGGPAMQRAGGTLVFGLSEHGIMGLAGVLRALPLLIRATARFIRLLRDDPPDLVVLVDYPGLHLVFGRLARRHGVPVLHYVAPQYWGWAPWRMKRYRGCVDGSLTILPFEGAFFARVRLPTAYVGHPVLDHIAAEPSDPVAVAAVRERATVCLLPGSRRSELVTNLQPYVEIARRLRRDHPELRFVLPHTDPRRAPMIREMLDALGADFIEFHPGSLAVWLEGSRVVLAKSGTGSLEACLYGTPTVVVYKIKSAISTALSRIFISVPWIAAANLVAGREVVPEFLFHDDAGWQRAEAALRSLLRDGPEREQCLADLVEVGERLGEPGASARVASRIRAFLYGPGENRFESPVNAPGHAQ